MAFTFSLQPKNLKMGGPLFMAVAFGLIGLWIVLLALPGLRPPPPPPSLPKSEEPICPACKQPYAIGEEVCSGCGGSLEDAGRSHENQ